jgi:hypothetical protein
MKCHGGDKTNLPDSNEQSLSRKKELLPKFCASKNTLT